MSPATVSPTTVSLTSRLLTSRLLTSRLLPLVLLVALVGAACSAPDTESNDPTPPRAEDRIISNVWRTTDANELEVGWFATNCEKFDNIKVDESGDRINLRLQAFVDSDNCQPPGTRTTIVSLQSPLGDRVVWDMNEGIVNTVLVEPVR